MLRLSLKVLLALGLCLVSPVPVAAQDDTDERDQALENARQELALVESALERRDFPAAAEASRTTYLAFEDAEATVEAADHELAETIEGRFEALRAAALARDDAAARDEIARLGALLDEAAGTESSPVGQWATFAQSFGIILREGFEALLLCTALAAAVLKSGAGRGVRAIWAGAIAALVASLATAILVERVLDVAPAGREAIEGITMVLAAGVLFYVSYWLLSKLEVARWMAYLKERVGGAGSRWALAGVAFLAVYREGVETILFYQALSGTGDALPIWAGLAAGVLVLAVLGTMVLRFGLRMPVRPLFAVTGALLYFLAVMFMGQGIHEFQEAGWVSTTAVPGIPSVGVLGLYPTVETLGGQAILVVLALLAGAVFWRRWRERANGRAEDRPPRSARPRERTRS